MAPRVMTHVTPEMLAQALAATDWARIDATDDAEIDRQIAADPDTAPLLSEDLNDAVRIQVMRRRLALTQDAFSRRFRIPLGTLRDWEQGRRRPDAPALALLRIIECDPEAAARALAA